MNINADNHTTKMTLKQRPRYGLVISTSSNCSKNQISVNGPNYNSIISESQWEKFCEKLETYHWCFSWNQTVPASWTVSSSKVKEYPTPQTYDINSAQVADLIHSLLDKLPGK